MITYAWLCLARLGLFFDGSQMTEVQRAGSGTVLFESGGSMVEMYVDHNYLGVCIRSTQRRKSRDRIYQSEKLGAC